MTKIEKVDGVETENNANDIDVDTTVETDNIESEEKVETKTKLSPEDEEAMLEGRLKRLRKKMGKEEPKEKASKSKKSDDIDFAREAYLSANGIKEADEIDLLNDFVSNTGKNVKEVLGSKFFQSELKELREAKAVKEALPSSSSRSNTSAKDTVDYWLKKIDSDKNVSLLDIPDIQLRRKVQNARYNSEKGVNSGSHFTNNPFGELAGR